MSTIISALISWAIAGVLATVIAFFIADLLIKAHYKDDCSRQQCYTRLSERLDIIEALIATKTKESCKSTDTEKLKQFMRITCQK
ncbi:hypothetical protein [Immundisolibacter sp.]